MTHEFALKQAAAAGLAAANVGGVWKNELGSTVDFIVQVLA